MVRLAQQVRLALEVLLVLKDQLGLLVLKDQLGLLGHRVLVGLLVLRDPSGLLGRLDPLAQQVRLARQAL